MQMAPACTASGGFVADVQHAIPTMAAWDCNGPGIGATPPTSWLFFTPQDFAAQPDEPTHFVTDIGRFDTITVVAMGPEGPLRSRTYRMADVTHLANGPKFALPLPDMLDATGIVVAVQGAWTPAIVSQARIESRHGPDGPLGWSDEAMLLLALLAGLLAAPLAYNLLFYRILKERFVLWMAATEVSMLVFVLVGGGVLHRFVDITLGTTVILSSLIAVLPLVLAAGYFRSYLEPEMLGETTDNLLVATAVATLIVALILGAPIAAFRPLAHVLFVLLPLPLAVVVGMAARQARRMGSRAVLVQAGVWAPLATGTLVLILRQSGFVLPGNALDVAFFLSILAHVTMACFSIVCRIDGMRSERERVNARLDALTNLIDLDPLTGIFNRRALEQRFAELRNDGFHALAVVDLDHFKRINDRFGHTTGDRVLQEVAAVLAGDKDAIAFRLGGEEFVVMLRGAQVQQRAEQLRRAITIRVANEVAGVDGPVTASMGLIESPPGGSCSMRQLYSQADRLLYEAKYSGRNRLISERIQVFDAPARDRRQQDRRAEERRAG
ncbi:diguanylate cyclase [Croceicoccus sp. BE223]|uniref:GGDEF domain-containing protein n=1 Tax=Croceicoccus sp. BE223 TaxID=2817716 RepID=UPI00285AC2A6|nr:diguanylate cyclase [Croceicoccus sp. BE223]MDR7102139.1 diguanylate cyclase (GGDEF)-like protein [Croceicoccus sp. BE223]